MSSSNMSMYLFENRLNSFTEQRLKFPYLSKGYKATPETLATAGFYFDPSPKFPDNVTCFLCHKSLDGWGPNDDPFNEHVQHSVKCSWVICRSSIKEVDDDELPFSLDDEDSWPNSKRMEQARIETFGNWWPHAGKKGWSTVKKIAKAGFYYTPTLDSDDSVTCIYCGLCLDGWEPQDDPLKEHRKRTPKCPFFFKPIKSKKLQVGIHSDGRFVELQNTLSEKSSPHVSLMTTSEKPQKLPKETLKEEIHQCQIDIKSSQNSSNMQLMIESEESQKQPKENHKYQVETTSEEVPITLPEIPITDLIISPIEATEGSPQVLMEENTLHSNSVHAFVPQIKETLELEPSAVPQSGQIHNLLEAKKSISPQLDDQPFYNAQATPSSQAVSCVDTANDEEVLNLDEQKISPLSTDCVIRASSVTNTEKVFLVENQEIFKFHQSPEKSIDHPSPNENLNIVDVDVPQVNQVLIDEQSLTFGKLSSLNEAPTVDSQDDFGEQTIQSKFPNQVDLKSQKLPTESSKVMDQSMKNEISIENNQKFLEEEMLQSMSSIYLDQKTSKPFQEFPTPETSKVTDQSITVEEFKRNLYEEHENKLIAALIQMQKILELKYKRVRDAIMGIQIL